MSICYYLTLKIEKREGEELGVEKKDLVFHIFQDAFNKLPVI